MGKNSNIIEINGQRYDAVSGAPIAAIDGVVRAVKGSPSSVKPVKKAIPKPVAITAKPTMSDVVGRASATPLSSPKPVASHKPQPGKTLMRHAVHKPGASFKRTVKAQSAKSLVLHHPKRVLAVKQAVHAVDSERLERAKQIPKAQQVKRFHQPPIALQGLSASLRQPSAADSQSLIAEQVVQTSSHGDLFQRALEQATSHQQPRVATQQQQRRRRLSKKALTISASSFVALAIIGLGVVQSWPAISLHFAASRAGFAASIPGYQPAGYRVGTITSTSGAVAVNFASNSSDNRKYTVSEKVSAWDSETLRDMFVLSTSHNNYQTVQAGGQTIYLYGDRDATWVSGGIWYTITSNGSLSDLQLANLVGSL